MMFGSMLGMMDNYESRRVALWLEGDRMVSTALVTDGAHAYETAFEHPEYNDGKMVIVEAYDTREEAQAGHNRWVKVMTEGPLPDELKDCLNSWIGELSSAMGNDYTFPRKPPTQVQHTGDAS